MDLIHNYIKTRVTFGEERRRKGRGDPAFAVLVLPPGSGVVKEIKKLITVKSGI